MRRRWLIFVLLLCCGALVSSCATEQKNSGDASSSELYPKDNKLPADAASALEHPDTSVLYSLEPEMPPWEHKSDPHLYGKYILGQLPLSADQAQTAANAFKSAIAPKRFEGGALCFNPRHALRVSSNGHMYDFLLCYECFQLVVGRDGKELVWLDASGSPDVLNSLLTAAQIPISQSAGSSRKN
jgi:hypothetical protein